MAGRHTLCVNTCILVVVSYYKLWVWAERTDDVYTAISELEPLLKTNERVVSDLSDYIARTERRISLLYKYLNNFVSEHEKAIRNMTNYIQNPMNAYKIIRRLTTDLKEVENVITVAADDSQKTSLRHTNMKYPTLTDLYGAAKQIARIQITYNLHPRDLKQGTSKDNDDSLHLTTNEYYDLSYVLFNEKEYEHALSWMLEALRSYESGDKGEDGFTKLEIMEFISWCHYDLFDIPEAKKWMKKVLMINPWYEYARNSQNRFIREEKFYINECVPEDLFEEMFIHLEEEDGDEEVASTYETLCRGEFEISREVSNKLYCRYFSRNHPFLKLGPMKMEQLYEQPDVYMFYDVLSETEIEMFKNYTLPKLVRSGVIGEDHYVEYRISKGAWMADSYSQVAKVTKRVSALTGLDMTTAEEFYIINYGIGGHYAPHYDFSLKALQDYDDGLAAGDRIATFLIYLTDVEKGGATVFPNLGLTVSPVRNAALFWMNQHPSGEGDFGTLHGGCPVLYGSKWIVTKWINQHGQEFIRPCNLEYQDQGFSRDIPKPLYRHSTRT